MNAPKPLRRAFVLVATAALTMTLAGIAPQDVSGQEFANPRFGFGLETMEVIGYDWPAGATVTLTVDRPNMGGSPDFNATTIASAPPLSTDTFLPMGNGNVSFQLAAGPFRPVPGDVMTMTDGTTIKEQVIPNLTVDLPNITADTVSGTATMPETSFLTVGSDFWWNDPATRENLEISDGAWTADFAGTRDIGADSQPWAYVTDGDGDTTASLAPLPQVSVDPAADRVWAADFAAGPVTLTIGRGRKFVYTTTVATENVFTGDCMRLDMWSQPTGNLARPTVALFNLMGVFDIQAGDVLTATDSVSTRTIVVDYLTVDVVDPATDTISGHADAPVTPHVGMDCSGYWGYGPATPVHGKWSYFFDPDVFPFSGLDVGSTGFVLGESGNTMVPWKAVSSFTGFFPPVSNPPLVNTVTAGRAIDVTFSLGGNYGLDIFAAGSPVSQENGTSETPTSGRLTYNTKTGRYTYVWRTEKAWAGTERELILRFRVVSESEQRADFQF